MSGDLHARFDGWLADGAPGEPPRDVAIHASVCRECLHKGAALDALGSIDLGLAALPPSRVSGPPVAARRSVGWARGSVAAAVVVMAVVTGAFAAPLLGGARNGQGEQQVLDATGTPRSTAPISPAATRNSTSATASATSSQGETDAPTPSARSTVAVAPPGVVTPRPTVAPTPRASAAATPPPATPAPTAAATPPPTPTGSAAPTPAATASPTPIVTPSPTPTPTATETPPPSP